MKLSTKIAAAAALILGLCAGSAFANPLENKNAIGIYAMGGVNAGGTFGIQYERRFAPFFSTKFDAYVLYNPSNALINGANLVYNFNAEADFRLYEVCWGECFGSRLFAYALAGHTGYAVTSYDSKNDMRTEEYHANAVVSAGFGIDMFLVNHISIPVTFGYMFEFPYNAKGGFCAGIGLRYAW